MEKINYKIGLDIGTNSVGWACVDDDNDIVKKGGKLLWGSRLFEEASGKKDRRVFRGVRRRLLRRHNRINELNRIVKPEMDKVDCEFFNKIAVSFKEKNDREDTPWSVQFFNSKAEYKSLMMLKDDEGQAFSKSIYHIRKQCMGEERVDFRLVYLCLHHIIKYRGNFLFDDNQAKAGSSAQLLEELENLNNLILEYLDIDFKINELKEKLSEILLDNKLNTYDKRLNLTSLFEDYGKNEKSVMAEIIKLMVGYTANIAKIFSEDFEKEYKLSFDNLDAKENEICVTIGDKYQIIECINRIYSIFTFNSILKGQSTLSEAKIKTFDEHRQDKANLKKLMKLNDFAYFTKSEFDKMFKKPQDACQNVKASEEQSENEGEKKKNKVLANYYIYINHPKDASWENFTKYVKEVLSGKNLDSSAEALMLRDVILKRIESKEFMPKQTTTENGAIPMQFNREELIKIIDCQGKYYPILLKNKDKLIKLFNFKIPYYYGPLNNESKFSWIAKTKDNNLQEVKHNEMITYENYDDPQVVDMMQTQNNFIERMLNTCEYMYGEKCMPKGSITCQFYEVLQELNGVKINDLPISNDLKQRFVIEKFCTKKTVTIKDLSKFLETQEGFRGIENKISGTSDGEKFNSNLSTVVFLVNRGMSLEKIKDNVDRLDEMVRDLTIFKEGECREKRLNKYADLLQIKGKSIKDDVLKQKFDGWSRLSKVLVSGIKGKGDKTILEYLWENPERSKNPPKLMNLISNDNFGFKSQIDEHNDEYMKKNKLGELEYIESSYCSPPVKRATWQALKLVDEIVKIVGCDPNKICVEFSSDSSRGQKESRYQKIKNLYKKILEETNEYNSDIKRLNAELDSNKEKGLDDDRVFLYFIQMGKSLYSMKPLNLDTLSTSCEIDHIIPRSVMPDDSESNRALVLKSENQTKKEQCFINYIDNEYKNGLSKSALEGWWCYLQSKNLLSPKKMKNLHTDLEDPQVLGGFVNRQLVETRQAIKLTIELLKQRYPDVECDDKNMVNHRVVALNASLSSAYRAMFGLYKLRNINDFHHAHDAYLSAVLGDYVYKKFDYLNLAKYNSFVNKNLKEKFFNKSIAKCEFGAIMSVLNNDCLNLNTGEVCWKKEWNTTIKNNIYNQKCFISRKCESAETGEFWGATINPKNDKKGAKLIPVNKNRADITKYGGFTNSNPAYTLVIKFYQIKKEQKVEVYAFHTINKIDIARAKNSKKNINEYIKENILNPIYGNSCEIVAKLNEWQLLEINGHPVYKKGAYYTNAKPLMLKEEQYKFLYSIKDNNINYKFLAGQELTPEKKAEINNQINERAIKFFDEILEVFSTKYSNMQRAKGIINSLHAIKEGFAHFDILKKIKLINNLFYFTGLGEANLSEFGLSSSYGRCQIVNFPINTSNLAIIDRSITGFYQTRKVITNNKKENN